MRKLLFLLLFLGSSFLAQAQSDRSRIGHYFNFTLGHLRPVGQVSFNEDIQTKNRLHANRYRISGGFFVNPRLAVGAGIGFDIYEDEVHKTFTYFAEGRWFKKAVGNTAFLMANIGRTVNPGAGFEKGFRGECAIGYKIGGLMPSIGLNLQHMSDVRYEMGQIGTPDYVSKTANIMRASISLNFNAFF